MEMTTPPNRSGFNRKPKSKKRFPKSHKSGINNIFDVPNEATAWLYGTMFLMAAAKLLAPFIDIATINRPSASVTKD